MDSILMCSNTVYMSNMVAGRSLRLLSASTMALWHNNIILTPQVTKNLKIWAKYRGYNCVRLLPYANGQHIDVLNHCVYVQDGCGKQFEVAVSLNYDIIASFWTHKWPRTPYSEPITVGKLCKAAAVYANGQHIDVFKHCLYVEYGCGKQFEVAVSLNHDIVTSFWLHKWPRTPKSEPSMGDKTV